MAKHFVDLWHTQKKNSFPTMNYSIKDLTPVAGFQWQAQDAGGAMSLLKYKAATANEFDGKTKNEAIEWLRKYNLDDIRATFAVREFIRRITEGWH